MIPRPVSPVEQDLVIQAEGLRYVYEGGVEAISDVDLRIRRGEYVAIVGGNGSGKTTLAKNLNGLLRPSSGRIAIAGQDSSHRTVAEIARSVGYAFQNPDHQLFSDSVQGEVRFGPRNLGYSEPDVSRLSDHAIEVMNLQNVRELPPLTLSLSFRRRVSIASVMAMDPQVIILDEPTTGLDAKDIDSLMEIINTLNREGHTIILITHDMRLVAKHAKRVVVMAAGRILLDSDPHGSFSDLDLISRSNLVPPPVTLLAHRLAKFGIPADIFSPEELAQAIEGKIGGGR